MEQKSYCIHRYTIPCTMNQSKSDICTLTTFTAQNHVLKVALICIAALVNIYSRKRTDSGRGVGGGGMDDDGRKKDS